MISALLLYALALGLCVAGVFALRRAWARRNEAHLASLAAGWLLILASLPLWMFASGADRGVAQLFVAVMLAGTGVVMVSAQNRAARRRNVLREAGSPAPMPSRATLARRLAVFALAGPGALAAAILLSAPVYAGLDILAATGADRLALILFFVPIMTGVLATLAVIDFPLRWRAGLIGGLVAAGGLSTLALS